MSSIMNQSYNDDNANIDESLRSEAESFLDLNCRRVSSNFSTCSSITHDFHGSFSTIGSFTTHFRDTAEEAEGKYSGEYLQWTQQCLVELEQHDSDLMLSPALTPCRKRNKSLRNKLLSPVLDDETYPFLSPILSPAVANHNRRAPTTITNIDLSAALLNRSPGTSTIVDEQDYMDDRSEFTNYGTTRPTDESLALNTLEEASEVGSSGCLSLLLPLNDLEDEQESKGATTSLVNKDHQHADAIAIGEQCDEEYEEPSERSFDDSTAYEVASVDTLDPLSCGSLFASDEESRDATYELSSVDTLDLAKLDELSESPSDYSTSCEGSSVDALDLKKMKDEEALCASVLHSEESSESSSYDDDSTTCYEVASVEESSLDDKHEPEDDEWESEVEDFDDRIEGQWKDELTASTCDMESLAESFSSLPISEKKLLPTENERPKVTWWQL